MSLSKQKSSLETLVMQVMAWNHPFSRKMVILHLESKEDWLGVQSYYVSQIQSLWVIQEQLTDQSVRVLFSVGMHPTELYLGFSWGPADTGVLCSVICLLCGRCKKNYRQKKLNVNDLANKCKLTTLDHGAVSWSEEERKVFSREKQEFGCWIWLSVATFLFARFGAE